MTEGYLEEIYIKCINEQSIIFLYIIKPIVSSWNHYILILNDRSFLCICFSIDISYQHFFCLIRYTSDTIYNSINYRKWFNNDKVFDLIIDTSITRSIGIVQE